MKIKLSVIVLITMLSIYSCSDAQDKFPDTITVKRSDDLVRIKGSKYFVKVPETYKLFQGLLRYQKTPKTYFQVAEIPNSDFLEMKPKISRQALESQGGKVDVYEYVRYNGFDAIYMEGPSKEEGETKLALWFGDETFTAMIVGVCLTSDNVSKEELKSIFSTSYYDKSYDLDPFEIANFSLDETITGFKYATTIANFNLFTPNGRADAVGQAEISGYQVKTFEAENFETAKQFLERINKGLDSKDGVTLSNIVKKELVINGNKAYQVTMDGKAENNKKVFLCQFVIYKESTNSAVLFMATDCDNGIYIDKFIATAHSIKL